MHYTPYFVSSKCRSLFNCESIIVGKELHASKGYHYHIGLLNDTASYNTATKTFCLAFWEFPGRQLNVRFHKSWNTICDYVFKQDKDPYCWGTTKEQPLNRLERRKKGKMGTRLKACKSWKEDITDSFLGARVGRSYSSIKQLYMDLKGYEEHPCIESRLVPGRVCVVT